MKFLQYTSILVAACLASPAQAEERPPNVVVIFADDLGYGDLGCYGATQLKTPNIDRLAREGRRFTDAHSASAVCTPSRYALVTGEYPFRKGLSRPVFLRTGLVVDPDRTTVADVMKNAGYATACIGKWHLGFGERTPDWNGDLKPGPLEVGFDYYFGVPVVNSHPPFVFVENHRVLGLVPEDPFVHGKAAKTQVFQEKMGLNQIGGADAAHALYKDEAVGTHLAEKSVQWIKANRDKPFFLYLATTNIHHPFTPAPRFQGTSECGRYGDFVHELDWIVGEVMNTLREQGLAESTLVIFTSDNGGMINQGGQDAIKRGHRLNGNLLGFKFDAWEGGHRVPFIARWPEKIEAASVSDQLISNVDLLATMAALTHQELEPGEGPDSFNVLPALTGTPDKPVRDHLVLAAARPTHVALRDGNWMFIGARGGGGFGGSKPGEHLLGGPAALKFAGQKNSDIVDGKLRKDAPAAQLYDLKTDPRQNDNVIMENSDRAKRMQARLQEIKAASATRPSTPKPRNATTASQRPPNFVVIFTDDQGYQDVGCFGSPDIRTPHLDAMAQQGMKFTSFYAQPICGPSRAALMTGCYPMRVAERGNLKHVHPILHSNEITIAEVLKDKGYATGCFGKWDLAKHSQRDFFIDLFPTRQGFDYFYGTPTSNDGVANLYRNEELIEPKSDMATLTRRYTDQAIGFMKQNQDKPFFVYLPHTMPHTRLDASEQFKGKSKRGLYGDVIEEIDFNVGRILDSINEMGLEQKTYVLFTSDNGPWLIKNKNLADGRLPEDHGGSAGPLRSGKVSTFEGGVRVPTILWGPNRVPAGTTCDQLASTMDVLPTLAALAGAQPPVDRVIDGEDIGHLFRGDFDKADPHKTYFYYLRVHLQAVRQGRWKLHLPRDKEPIGAAPFSRNNHIAPVDRVGFDKPFLVDLANDIGETTNVADQNPELVERLLALAEAMREDLGDYDRVGKNMRFFDVTGERPNKPPVPAPRKRPAKPNSRQSTQE